MNYRLVSTAVAFALCAAWALPGYGQARPEVLLKQRQAVMTLQGKYFYPMRNMAQGKVPYDASVVARNVTFMDSLARMPWDGFAASTKDLKSGATPAVFAEPAKFKEAADRLQAEMTRLTEVSRKGDEAATRQQILAVNKTCNACHDNFRERQ